MEIVKGANLGLRFVLELCVLAALAYWGYHAGNGRLTRVALAVGAPLLAAVVWGVFGAPKASRQLHDPALLLLEIVVFGAGALALAAADQRTLAIAFALAAMLNGVLMYVWGQR
jgi:hypothetical protein